MAISVVSRSRNSPTKITFGASRNAARRPMANVEKSLPSSRWQNVEVLCGCTNSMGSSSVTMWPGSFSLNSLSRAARVVVLPEPVAPVTRMRPVFLARHLAEDGRQVQRFDGRNLRGEDSHDDPVVATLAEDVDAQPAAAADGVAELSHEPVVRRSFTRRAIVADETIHDAFEVERCQDGDRGRHGDRLELAVGLHLERTADDERTGPRCLRGCRG